MPSDIAIAQATTLWPIGRVAAGLGLGEDDLDLYGRYKAKIHLDVLERLADRPDGKLVLVTALTPTVAGEGKTTTTVGLGQALNLLGKRAVIALREPSMGPVFGMKGGATGGGYAQVAPMEDINLHFTGDFHAIAAANNLLAALIDNHLEHGNALGLDPRRITWRRCLDMNDRALRQIVSGLGGTSQGVPRETGFDITAASEIMAVVCLATGLEDLQTRLARIVVGRTRTGAPVTAGALDGVGAMTALLRDALQPNLAQTLEHTPAIIHGGPFANIAHGCNSVLATRMALKLGEIALTEAGFGSDLGAEKFFDIVCRSAELRPDAAVVVGTVRALKLHGGVAPTQLGDENIEAVRRGLTNLLRHVAIVRTFGVPAVVSLNRFPTDTAAELDVVLTRCSEEGIPCALSDVWAQGGAGGADLGRVLLNVLETIHSRYAPIYPLELSLAEKIRAIATRIYGARGVNILPAAIKALERLEKGGWGELPVCIAKTQYSFTDDPSRQNVPEDFEITVREVRLSAGAGFVVALTGDILTMPGLPKVPSAGAIQVRADGVISGLS